MITVISTSTLHLYLSLPMEKVVIFLAWGFYNFRNYWTPIHQCHENVHLRDTPDLRMKEIFSLENLHGPPNKLNYPWPLYPDDDCVIMRCQRLVWCGHLDWLWLFIFSDWHILSNYPRLRIYFFILTFSSYNNMVFNNKKLVDILMGNLGGWSSTTAPSWCSIYNQEFKGKAHKL